MVVRGQTRRLAAEKAKLIPIWNPYNRKISTLEEVADEFVNRRRSTLRGSAFEKDPVQAVGLLMLHDTRFAYEARVLRSESGEWYSLKEALNVPSLKDMAKELAFRHLAASTGLERGDLEVFDKSISGFADGVEIANAMSYGPRVRTMVEKLVEREELDPGVYRRTRMEVRAAILQAEARLAADAEESGGNVLTAAARKATKQAKATSGDLLVIARRDGGPVSGATIILFGTDTSASGKTDRNGRCLFRNLSAGSFSVKAISDGQKLRQNAEVKAGLTASALLDFK